ncbi:MAG: hypothetical protein EHM78_25590 [Myxococcaceae bacterium]|nr:MAG: hypothetical protein EHM78_25590 [Myxococcaceae bacterium]
MEEHERAAQAFTTAAGATLLAAAVALALRKRPGPFLVAGGASVALSVGMLVLGIQTGSRGGALVHGGAEVVRGGEPRPGGLGQGPSGQTSSEEEEEDDDD